MSLPAWQQRILDHMESALQVSEPHLASMFAIFARLNADEPVGQEPLARPRPPRRWSPPGSAMYAIVLIPLIFSMIVLGALLGGSASSAKTCEVGYSVSGNSPLIARPSCQTSGKQAAGKPASGSGEASCIATALAARHAAGTTPAMCYK